MIWFTADMHYGHTNIIGYCDRPFRNSKEMDTELMDRWNEVVCNEDEVYVIGDVCLGYKIDKVVNILQQLKGKKYLILGNHDRSFRKKSKFCDEFEWVKDLYSFEILDLSLETGCQPITLRHYPIIPPDQESSKSWMLHGHCHGTLNKPNLKLVLDVGVDSHNFYPICYDEIKIKMKARNLK